MEIEKHSGKKIIPEKFNENKLEGIFQLFVVNGNSLASKRKKQQWNTSAMNTRCSFGEIIKKCCGKEMKTVSQTRNRKGIFSLK